MSVTTAAPTGPAFRRLAATELKLYLRERVGPVWGVGFPLVLLIIFGSIPSFGRPTPDLGGRSELEVYVPVLVAFVTAMLALVALPSTLTGYRERGVLRRLRTTPVGPGPVLAAQLVVNLAALVATVVLLLVVARFGYGVGLPQQLGGFVVAALFGAAALLAVGLFVAAVAPSARAAQAIGTVLFFPMMFFAGLWLQIAQMPPLLRHLSQVAPLGATVQALQASAQGQWPQPQQLLTTAVYAVVFATAAIRLFRWE